MTKYRYHIAQEPVFKQWFTTIQKQFDGGQWRDIPPYLRGVSTFDEAKRNVERWLSAERQMLDDRNWTEVEL